MCCCCRCLLCCHAQVLLEVAASVQHLHNMQLLHCDIKPENVLLKSNNSNPLGFTTKLSDFGLAKLLRDNYYIINRSGSGTVTHLAPELFQVRGVEGGCMPVVVHCFGCVSSVGVAAMLANPLQLC
jgi:serine/threonine protein kinase